jgi:hypothetical protein
MTASKSLAVLALVCFFDAAVAQETNHWGPWRGNKYPRPNPWRTTPATRLLILKSTGLVPGSESGVDATAVVGDTGTFS